MMRVVVPMVDGVEEIEAVGVIDTLRRAGWQVTVAGLDDGSVTASRGVRLLSDVCLPALSPGDYDMLVVPGGGGGVDRLMASDLLCQWICDFNDTGRYLAAICAGPRVLYEAGILAGRKVTCYPGIEKHMPGISHCVQKVVIDGRIVTSQGAGTAVLFALSLIALVDGDQRARQIASEMIADYP